MRILIITLMFICAGITTSQTTIQHKDTVEYSIYKLNTKIDEAIHIISLDTTDNGVRTVQEQFK